jgi:hypothetical protein
LGARPVSDITTPVMFPPGRARLATNPSRTTFAAKHDDGDRLGRVFGRLDRFVADGDDGLHPKLNQLPSQPGKSIALTLGESPLDDEILAFSVAQLLERRREQHGYAASVRWGRSHDLREYPDSEHFPWLLSPGGNSEWPGKKATSHHRHESSALHYGLPRGEVGNAAETG